MILVAASVLSVIAALWFGRGTTFSGDELVWVASTPGIDLYTVFQPHGGHLLALTRLVYWPLLEVFGLAYLPFRLLAIAATLLTVWLLFEFGRRRTDPLVALAPCLVLLFFGSDYLHLLQGNGFTVMLSVAMGIAALLSLEADTRKGDLLACLWLVIGVFAYTVILPFVAGAAVMIALRRSERRPYWVAAIPLAIYGLWRIWLLLADAGSIGGGIEIWLSVVVPAWGFQSLSAVLNALTGLSYGFDGTASSTPTGLAGPPLALLALFVTGRTIARRGLRSGLLVATVVLISLFAIQCLASGSAPEGRFPGDARYMYPGAVVVLLCGFELARRWRPGRSGLVALALVALCGIGANLTLMANNSTLLREQGRDFRANVGAVALVVEGGPDDGRARPEQRTIGDNSTSVAVAMYFQDYGRFGYGADALRGQPPERRDAADRILVGLAAALGSISLTPAAEGSGSYGCRVLSAADGSTVTLEAPPGRLLMRSATGGEVRVGRFADLAAVPVGSLSPGQSSALDLPSDSAQDPWQIAFVGPKLRVCSRQ